MLIRCENNRGDIFQNTISVQQTNICKDSLQNEVALESKVTNIPYQSKGIEQTIEISEIF